MLRLARLAGMTTPPRNPNVTPARERLTNKTGRFACECWRFVVIAYGNDGTMQLYPPIGSCDVRVNKKKAKGLTLAAGHNMRLIDRACAAHVEGLECAVLPPKGEAGAWCPTDPYEALREASVNLNPVHKEKYETRAKRDRERRANAEQMRINKIHKAQAARVKEMV